MDTKANKKAVEKAKVEDLSPVDDVSGGANDRPRLTDNCKSYNRRTVADTCEITYLAPTRLGDVLTATAVELRRKGRDGTYDVTVRAAAGVVTEFVGKSLPTVHQWLRAAASGNGDLLPGDRGEQLRPERSRPGGVLSRPGPLRNL